MLSDSAVTCIAPADAQISTRDSRDSQVEAENQGDHKAISENDFMARRIRYAAAHTAYRYVSHLLTSQSSSLVEIVKWYTRLRSRRLRCYYRRDITLRNAISWRTSDGELHETTRRTGRPAGAWSIVERAFANGFFRARDCSAKELRVPRATRDLPPHEALPSRILVHIDSFNGSLSLWGEFARGLASPSRITRSV